MENKTNKRRLTPIETIDAYKAFCDFRKYMYQAIEKFPKWIKHSEGAACIASIKDCVRFLSVIARTYDEKVKLNYIDAFLAEWDVVSDSVLFFFDKNLFHGIFSMYSVAETNPVGEAIYCSFRTISAKSIRSPKSSSQFLASASERKLTFPDAISASTPSSVTVSS